MLADYIGLIGLRVSYTWQCKSVISQWDHFHLFLMASGSPHYRWVLEQVEMKSGKGCHVPHRSHGLCLRQKSTT